MTNTSLVVVQERLRANAWGRYYVTAECNGCGLCASYAPVSFAAPFDRGYYAVAHQPLGPAEEAAVRTAMLVCPFRCIHDDGDRL
jgi:ferredoxin